MNIFPFVMVALLSGGQLNIFSLFLDTSGENSRSSVQISAIQSDTTWLAVLIPPNEPGEPMIVTGTVYAPDGKTPVSGIKVYVYHTDVTGYYQRRGVSGVNPRLKGIMITNPEGKYEYRTIKPGSYPEGKNPAHVHYVISGKGYVEQGDELLFEGDPFLSKFDIAKSNRDGKFASIQPLSKDSNGILRIVKNIRLK